jgi:hypothetical protein
VLGTAMAAMPIPCPFHANGSQLVVGGWWVLVSQTGVVVVQRARAA